MPDLLERDTPQNSSLSDRSSLANLSFYLFIAGCIVGLIQLQSPVQFGAGFEMFAEAKNLAAHGAFANPFLVAETGPTAVNPPLYPFFLGMLMKIFSAPMVTVFIAAVLGLVANATTAALLPRISLLFYGDAIPGVMAGVLWLAAAKVVPIWDTSLTIAGSIIFCLSTASEMGSATHRIRTGALAGLGAGALFLLNPSSMMIYIPWLAYLAWRHRRTWRKQLSYLCTLFAILLLIVAGWALRNKNELGSLVLRTNLGMTLYASNNDCAESSLIAMERNGCYQTHHPNMSLSEAQLLRTLGEVEYDRQRIVATETWALAHKSRFLALAVTRFGEFWFPSPAEYSYRSYAVWLITALSIPGMILMIRRHNPVTLFVSAVLLIYPLMYYLVVTDIRYRYPVLWLSLLPAGYFLSRISSKLRSLP